MKLGRIITLAGSFALLTGSAFGAGSEAIIKERAKELSNQNNVRQGVPPPTQPPQPGQPGSPPTQVLKPTALGRLQLALAAIKVDSAVTAEQKQQISRELIASAQSTKPTQAAADKLAGSLSAAFAEKVIPPADLGRLIQDLNMVLNGTILPATQITALGDDIQAIFQKNGLNRNKAVIIATDVKAIGSDIQKPPPAK